MITRNGSRIFGYPLGGISINASTRSSIKNIHGELYSGTSFSALQYLKYASSDNISDIQPNTQYIGVVMNFGVGTTPPAKDDVYLDDTMVGGVDINTLLPCQGTKGLFDCDSEGNLMYTYNFRNTSGNSVTIREIGLSYVDPHGKFLLARTVLSSPRTVQAGESFTFTYKINMG